MCKSMVDIPDHDVHRNYFHIIFLCRRTRLTGPRLGLNSGPAAHCTCHALLHMALKWSSHWTTRAHINTFVYIKLVDSSVIDHFLVYLSWHNESRYVLTDCVVKAVGEVVIIVSSRSAWFVHFLNTSFYVCPRKTFTLCISVLQLAKKYHPDINRNDPEAQRKFQAVSEAYEVQYAEMFDVICCHC